MTTDPQDRRGPRQDHEPADDELDPGLTVSPLSDFRTDIQISEIEAEQAEVAHGAVLRNSSWMAAGSIISRITGIARDIALVAALGQYVVADLFQIGNSLPDIVYVLILGGALNAVFVPQLVRRMKDDCDQGQAYTDSLLSLTGVLLVILTVVAVLAAPFIVGLYATDEYSAQQTDLAVAFARLCLPQIFFFGLYTMNYFVEPELQPKVRRVPCFYTPTRFRMESVKIGFYREGLLDKILYPLIKGFTNAGPWTQDFYERRLCSLFHARQITYRMRPVKAGVSA